MASNSSTAGALEVKELTISTAAEKSSAFGFKINAIKNRPQPEAKAGSSKVKSRISSTKNSSVSVTEINANEKQPATKATFGPDAKKRKISASPENPFLVDLIVQNLMGYLNAGELLASRRVCKLFDAEAQKALQKKEYSVNLSSVHAVSQFVRDTKKRLFLPFTKFSLSNMFSPRIKNHFSNFGDQVKVLTINIDCSPRARGLINLDNIFAVFKTTPNLESLALLEIDIANEPVPLVRPDDAPVLTKLRKIQLKSHFEYSSVVSFTPGMEERLRVALEKFFRVAPDLETLDVHVRRILLSRFSPLPILLRVIHDIPGLKHLRIHDELVRAEVALLKDSRFQLESLKIEEVTTTSTAEPVFLPVLLRDHANTIHTLDININSAADKRTLSLPLPRMANLKHLTLNSKNNRLGFGNFFHSLFPKLTQLDLVNVSHETLTNAFLGLNFVEDLKISSEEGFRGKDINSILCGIPDPEYTMLSMQKFRDAEISDDYICMYEHLSLFVAKPSLRNMTNLKTLEISVNRQRCGTVNDSTAYFALIRMNRLNKLIVPNGGFTATMIHELKKHHVIAVVG